MQCDAIGNGWSETRTIGPLTGQVHADDIVAIIGFERSSIDLAAAAELSGSNSRMAELLGYPRCCTEAYQEISKLRDRWALYYATSQPANQGIFSANRLASHIAGVSLVGEMFPCSIHCLEAAAYGQSNLQLMKRSGLNALANLYQDILQRPILINSEGEVSFYSDPNSLTPGAVTISFMGQNVE